MTATAAEELVHKQSVPKIIPFYNALRRYHQHDVVGLENIPRTGGALVIPNHSFATYDVVLLGAVVYEKYGRVIRGLADRLAFQVPGLKSFLYHTGMVEAGFENATRMLNQGEILGIPPGGMRESLRSHRERYQINWEGRKGFARLSIASQCPIILAACPRSDELYTIYAGEATKFIYKHFKLPAVIPVGLGGTLIPRPIQLIHYLSEPIHPPKVSPNSPEFEDEVTKFQRYVADRMKAWLAESLQRARSANPTAPIARPVQDRESTTADPTAQPTQTLE